MIDNPVFCAIWALCETSMSNAVYLIKRILVENTTFVILPPILHIHWIVPDKFKLTKTIISVVGTCCGIYDKILTRCRIDKLLRSFIGGQTHIERTTVRRLLPRIRWDTEDLALSEIGTDSPGIIH